MKTSVHAYEFYKLLTRETPDEESHEKSHAHCHVGSHDHSKERILYERPIDEKYKCCLRLKTEGNESFKNGDYKLALSFYKRVMIQLDYTFPEDAEWTRKFDEVKKTTHLNMAIANYKLGNYHDSIQNCNEVLREDPDNVKALTRRSMCLVATSKFKEAREDLLKIATLDQKSEFPQSELERIKQLVRRGIKKGQEGLEDSQQRSLYKSMFGKMAKGSLANAAN